MKNEIIIRKVTGGGKTTEILNKSDNGLIVTKTITLSQEIKRKLIHHQVEVVHYHQLIWDTGKRIGIPLSLNDWNDYQDKLIFEHKKDSIQKYSKIFIDINENELKNNWLEILKRYFLEEDGQIYTLKDLDKGQSFRFNSSITNFINHFFDKKIESSSINDTPSTFYVPTNRSKIIDDITNILKPITKKSDVTIIASNLEELRFVEENLTYQKHLSFLTNQEENNFQGTSLDLHWKKKNRSLDFDSNTKKLKIATLEDFKGLESETVFFILTDNILDNNSFQAITRAKKQLYIFNYNYENSDELRLHADKIVTNEKEIKNNVYLALRNESKKHILKKYFKHNYNIDLNNKELVKFNDSYKVFFEKIFPSTQKLEIYNYDKKTKEGVLQVAITHNDTNIVLIVEQSKNYFLCNKIENKAKFILGEHLKKDVKLIFDNGGMSDINITHLLYEIEEYPSIIPVEETQEYKKWQTYLELIEKSLMKKSESFTVNVQFDNNIAKFSKPKNKHLKFSEDTELLIENIDDEKNNKFGKIIEIYNNKIKVELDNNFEKTADNRYDLSINYIREQSRLETLKKGLKSIKYNDFRFYIFGDQKLPQIDDSKKLNIVFKNKDLNEKQEKAIKKALLSKKIFMIQGPPGTGKTSVIAEIAYQETTRGKKVLISSESNTAIENALEKLDEDIFFPLLHQSDSRKDKDTKIIINLPTEENLGSIYKSRIIKRLKIIVEYITNEVNKLELIGNNLKTASQNIKDTKKIKEIFRDNYIIPRQKLEKQSIFLDIQNEFLEELSTNTECEKELKDLYLKKINIVGATLNQIGKASQNFNNSSLFDVVIVDEVSKATPLELNLAILKAKKVILVGDQKQLPPMLDENVTLEEFADKIFINSEDKTKQEIKRELHQHKTVFEKLIDNNPHAYVQLTTQYRMHENIQKAINQFYDESLECGLDNKTRKNQHQLFGGYNLVWVDTSSSIEKGHNPSFSNEDEVNKTKVILEKLEKEYEDIDFKPTVGIISFYGKQVDKLKKNIKNNFKNIEVDFGTVDTFQGQERDFIIVSMVRSNENSNIGFAKILNRINVAFSRAKQLLIILGSYRTFTTIQKRDDKNIVKAKKIYKNIYDMSEKGGLL